MARRAASDEIKVTIQRVGADDEVVRVEKGATAGDALVAAGLPRDSEFRIDGEQFDSEDYVEDGDVLVVSTKKYAQG